MPDAPISVPLTIPVASVGPTAASACKRYVPPAIAALICAEPQSHHT